MTLKEIRQQYFDFCEENGHKIIPSDLLIPENDPSTLFTSSGMQPLMPYLMGQKYPLGTRIANSQKCFRAEDIDEVGDNRHTTFFEMLGNWSFGDYFKEEQLKWFFIFLIDEIKLDPTKIYVTCFMGDEKIGVKRDVVSAEIWKKLFSERNINTDIALIGTEKNGGVRGMKDEERIFYYDASKNWWSRSGAPQNMPAGEIGGADSEVFYDFGDTVEHDTTYGENCHPNCDCGRFMEIGNSVFMEYVKENDGSFATLPKKNVDFGGGLERMVAATNNDADIFNIDVFSSLIKALEKESGKLYRDEEYTELFRVVADHIRGAVFMIADGVVPSNKEQGYILRRLLRRSTLYGDRLGIAGGKLGALSKNIISSYRDVYSEIQDKNDYIIITIADEEEKFRHALVKGLKQFQKVLEKKPKEISGHDAFILFTTYGFPYELTEELADENGKIINRDDFDKEFKKHQKLSQTASAGKFKGGLADTSKKTTAFHTTTHLMLAVLREVLGDDVHQSGANITAERIRFDFTHTEKVDRGTLDIIERKVNAMIEAHAHVSVDEMEKKKAKFDGAEGMFWGKYPNKVTVYTVTAPDDTMYSHEVCGGPHVKNTKEIEKFGKFKIIKEKSSGAGIRRIKAVLEKIT